MGILPGVLVLPVGLLVAGVLGELMPLADAKPVKELWPSAMVQMVVVGQVLALQMMKPMMLALKEAVWLTEAENLCQSEPPNPRG